MKCFHHNDADGKAAAFCVRAWAKLTVEDDEKKFISVDYTNAFPFETVKPNEEVWIVDFSLKSDDFIKLLSITKNVTWIDHHGPVIEELKQHSEFGKLEPNIRGVRRSGEAGCVLTWKYIHWYTDLGRGQIDISKNDIPNKFVPDVIRLIGDYDVHSNLYGNNPLYLLYAMKTHNTRPTSEFWWNCMAHEVSNKLDVYIKPVEVHNFWTDLMAAGKMFYNYEMCCINEAVKLHGYVCKFHDYSCFAMNEYEHGSQQLGGDEALAKYDILIRYHHNGIKFKVSLYSAKVDVSVIARKYGGNGHKAASGFTCDQLPFRKETVSK